MGTLTSAVSQASTDSVRGRVSRILSFQGMRKKSGMSVSYVVKEPTLEREEKWNSQVSSNWGTSPSRIPPLFVQQTSHGKEKTKEETKGRLAMLQLQSHCQYRHQHRHGDRPTKLKRTRSERLLTSSRLKVATRTRALLKNSRHSAHRGSDQDDCDEGRVEEHG